MRSEPPLHVQPLFRDDRDAIQPGDRVVLIVEDDARFAMALLELVREGGFRGVVALDGRSALALAKDLAPDAITLDLKLPDMDGWAVLDMLKHDPETRHIPVNVISVHDQLQRCFHMGALGAVQKPAGKEALQELLARTRVFVEREVKTVLIANADREQRDAIADALAEGVGVELAGSGAEALEILRTRQIDCLIVGPALRDMGVVELLKRFARTSRAAEVPIVLYGAEGLPRDDQDNLRRLAELVILRRVASPEAVLEETTLFLHQALEDLPQRQRGVLAARQNSAADLAGRKALIVDDDIRNIFALTGALEQLGMVVINAESGKDGIEMLKTAPDTDIVLMDIMMPDLDGYDTMRIIRGMEQYKELPIIAVTARAMKGDREKCIEAGASDYIAKPVNMEQLVSLLRVWLMRR
jgi:CheY-like chemotaxis protein